jgi:hypothetical protein
LDGHISATTVAHDVQYSTGEAPEDCMGGRSGISYNGPTSFGGNVSYRLPLCPSWCVLHEGPDPREAAFVHRRPVVSVDLCSVAGPSGAPYRFGSSRPAEVCVEQLARGDGSAFPALAVLRLPEPEDAQEPRRFDLTAVEARAVGAGLLRAADVLDGMW